MTIVKDMTKEMLRRGRNFDHLTVECQHVHNNFSLMRRASEYKCEIVNRITDVGYLSQSPPQSPDLSHAFLALMQFQI